MPSPESASEAEAQSSASPAVESTEGGGNPRDIPQPGQQQSQWTDEEWHQWNSWWEHWSSNAYWTGGSPEAPSEAAQQLSGQGTLAQAAATASDGQTLRQWQPQWRSEWDSGRNWYGPQGQGKGDFSDPPQWPGWSHYRLWKKAIYRWDANTDIVVWRRADKVLKNLEWDLQGKLEHIGDQDLRGDHYLERIFSVLDVLAGEKETSEKRRSIRAALYEGSRKSEESLSQYALRRQAQFASADRYLQIPDDLKAFMLEEQAGLTKQGVENEDVANPAKSAALFRSWTLRKRGF